MNKFIAIWTLIGAFTFSSLTYCKAAVTSEMIEHIKEYRKQKTYTPSTTGPLLTTILDEGRVAALQGEYDGLKKRLVSSLNSSKLKKQVAGASDVREGKILSLLDATVQTPVYIFITDRELVSLVKGSGKAVRQKVRQIWARKALNNADLFQVFEDYPPEVAAQYAEMVAITWYRGVPWDYENWGPSWASESLHQVYTLAYLAELAKRSVAVRLLAEEGYIYLPDTAYTEFRYSGRPSVPINISFLRWSEADIPKLQALVGNVFYSGAAQRQLERMGK